MKTSKTKLQFGFLSCRTLRSLLLAANGSAQTYSINWYKIAGGGGTSSGGQYTVSGTIGQPDASTAMTGGNYSLTGGFWAFISVVQTAGAPTLYISQSGKTVTVYWQNVSGWTLQQNNNPAAPASWTLNGSWSTQRNQLSESYFAHGPSFFRLANP